MKQSGRVNISYVIDDDGYQRTSICVHVSICGVTLWDAVVPRAFIEGRQVCTVNAQGRSSAHYEETSGMAMSHNTNTFMVSYSNECKLRLFRYWFSSLEEGVSGGVKQLWQYGERGVEPLQFAGPCKMCFHTSTGNLLVCEQENDRVQELAFIDNKHLSFWNVPAGIAIKNDKLFVLSKAEVHVFE